MEATAPMTLWIRVMFSMLEMEATPRPSAESWKHQGTKAGGSCAGTALEVDTYHSDSCVTDR